jgi:hypothetical protein
MADKITSSTRARPAAASMVAVAAGVIALGAIAIGAVAIGRLAIGGLAIKRARFGALEVDELTVRRLHVVEDERRR